MISDSIADILVRINNAGAVKKSSVVVPFSNFKMAIAEVLLKEGYIKSFNKQGKKANKFLEIELIYNEQNLPRIKGSRRISKSSRRVYGGAKDIKPVKRGYGMTVLSTPLGVMSGEKAQEKNVGGEILFEIW